MIRYRPVQRDAPRWIIRACLYLHIAWAALLWGWASTSGATALNAMVGEVDRHIVSIILLCTAAAASFGLRAADRLNSILFLMPQQIVLSIAAGSGINAMIHSHYADGVYRPAPFIIADQLPAVALAVAHLLAVVSYQLADREVTPA